MIPAIDDEINREETQQIKTDEKLMKNFDENNKSNK